ncbi:MAG: GAF domain-containing protein [Deltaproteobacteria bacterium]|nr:GAF domain-containing protein [Deltaproteobacteria bacterium]
MARSQLPKKQPPPRRPVAGSRKTKPASRPKQGSLAGAKRTPRLAVPDVPALERRITKLTSLLDVAKAMTALRDLDQLLKLILDEALKVVDADRCSIWIVDRERNEIWTKVAHGLAKEQKIRIPLGVGIAGQVAATGKIINIPDAYADPRFNRQVDKDTGYRTRNILGVPMRYTTGEVTGVLQALNKVKGEAFTDEDADLLLALGANAASAIENAILYEEIDRLFEGFVKASVVAIESRDPTTSGHSERVAELTLGIAENLQRLNKPQYADIRFTTDDMREIRYAALLHDFGKVGVREHVLTKANKLYPGELEMIETRFRALSAQKHNAYLLALVDSMKTGAPLPSDYETALKRDMEEIDRFLGFIRECNRPTVLDSSGFDRLHEVARITYIDGNGKAAPVLSPRELDRLSIPRGSLDQDERLEIESHVTHTFRFLSQIPWTRDLRRVPEIAYAHHEKLDGAGYPRQLQADQIPVQSRMMTIADIYDALTASDRPYKRAVPHERALSILEDDCKVGKIDRTLLDVFIGAQVHLRVLPAAQP